MHFARFLFGVPPAPGHSIALPSELSSYGTSAAASISLGGGSERIHGARINISRSYRIRSSRCAAETIRCEVSLRNSLRAVERVSALRVAAPLLAPFSQASFVLIRAHHARARQVCESRTTTPSSPAPHFVSAFAGLTLEMQKASVDGSINKCDADPRTDDGRCALCR